MIPRMVHMVQEDHAKLRSVALKIVRAYGCGVRDNACKTKAVYEYVVRNFHWQEDPILEETLMWPKAFVTEMESRPPVYADCASVNTALVSLLGALGIRAVFVFGSDGQSAGDGEPLIYHVWSGVPMDGKMFYLEPTVPCPAGRARKFASMFVRDPWDA